MHLYLNAPAHECLHGARLNTSPRSRKVFRLQRPFLPPPRPPTHSTSGLFLRTSTCRGGKRSVSCHHRACSRMPPWSLPQDVILCRARSSGSQGSSLPPLPLPTHSTSVTLLENLYLSMRRDACVSSSSRLLTDAFMELASTRDLDRARSSGSKDPSPPQPPVQSTSVTVL